MPRDEAHLLDMIQFAQDAIDFVRGRTYDDFVADRLLQSAVIRAVEVVGEAARRVSPTFAIDHAEIPWKAIIGTRHRLAHDYATVDLSIVWGIATVQLPQLVLLLKALVPPPDGSSELPAGDSQ
jgi:uncharacterized protein with HEPN domain